MSDRQHLDWIIHEKADTPAEYSILRNEITLYFNNSLPYISLSTKAQLIVYSYQVKEEENP
uniref:Uncharacterized protein n=1 Tax=viral metagenome TaxID=1070528 RepID=A0A6M3LIU5_9ZZZZ